MTRLVLHAGPAKTATTYIQNAFAVNRDALLDVGVDYPETLTFPPYTGHHGLAAALARNPWGVPPEETARVDDALAEVVASESPTVVLSTEGMFEFSDDAWRRVLDASGERDAEIVFYLRRWSEAYPSRWQQIAKARQVPPLAEYLLRQLPANGQHRRAVDRLARQVDPDRFWLVLLDDPADDPFEVFCRTILGIETPAGRPEKSGANTSLSPAATELMRQLHQRDQGATGDLFGRLQSLRERHDQQTAEIESMIGSKVTEAEPVSLDWLDELHRPSEAELLRDYRDRIVNHHGGDTLFRMLSPDESAKRRMQIAEFSYSAEELGRIDDLYRRLRSPVMPIGQLVGRSQRSQIQSWFHVSSWVARSRRRIEARRR